MPTGFKISGHFCHPNFHVREHHGGFGISGAEYNFNLRKINRRWAQIRLPKVGRVKLESQRAVAPSRRI